MTKKTTKPSSTQPLSILSEPSIAASEPSIPGGTTVEFVKSLELASTEQPISPKPENAAKKVKEQFFAPGRTKAGRNRGTKALGQSTDPTFAWVRTLRHEDPGVSPTEMEQWRALAAEFMAGLNTSGKGDYGAAILSLRMFMEHYAWKHKILNPESLLTVPRGMTLPPLLGPKSGVAPYRDNRNGAKFANYLHDFLTWVIKEKYSSDEDGELVAYPGFRVPFLRAFKKGGTPNESVRSPLGYPYICELRALLAPGDNFSDWTWAQSVDGGDSGTRSGNWFEVDNTVIDKSDPDCVWRVRERTIFNYQLPDPDLKKAVGTPVGKKTVYEMWSPVVAVALLCKLEMPWRTFQTRMLDSGEADSLRIELDPEGEQQFLESRRAPEENSSLEPESRQFSHRAPLARKKMFVWNDNPNRETLQNGLMLDQRDRVADAQGVFLKGNSDRSGEYVGFFVNTNKTADDDKAWHLRGYKIPYQHDSLHRWLVKLRNWQQKYNPIAKPTLWTELGGSHFGSGGSMKSVFDLQAAAPTCFLFRDASARGKRPDDERKPITDGKVDDMWIKLLAELEDRKDLANETDNDGKPIKFLKVRRKYLTTSTSFFPLHALRVSLITALADGGMELDMLMKLAGHTRLVMTIYYRKINAWQMSEGMREAQENLVKRADQLTVASLKGQHYENLPQYVVADQDGLRKAVPEDPSDRNAAGWERQLGGWCLMGGNTVPTASDYKSCGGCFNGGVAVNEAKGKYSRIYAGVKPKACMECRCRWFVSRPEYILEIRAKMMLLLTRLSTVQQRLDEAGDQLMALGREKIKWEREQEKKDPKDRQPYSRLPQYHRSELLRNQLSIDVDEVLKGIANVSNLSDRVLSIAMVDEQPGQQWVAQGTGEDLRWAIEPVNSELLVLSDVCLNAEIYPELAPDSEAAIVRRGQLLDVHLQKAGKGLVFGPLTPAEQNVLGNRLTRELAKSVNYNLPAAVALIEKGESPLVSSALDRVLADGVRSIPLRNLLKS